MFVSDNILILSQDGIQDRTIVDRFNHGRFLINRDMMVVLDYIRDNHESEADEIVAHLKIPPQIIDTLLDDGIITTEISRRRREYYHRFRTDDSFSKVIVEVTNRCNLSCKHCYNDSGFGQSMSMDPEIFERLMILCVQNGVFQVLITGGEPLCSQYFQDYIRIANKYGMVITLFSNLTSCDVELADFLKSNHVGKVITSIESSEKNVHDRFRGANGSFDRTMQSIHLLRRHSIDVDVNLVIGNHNLDTMEETMAFIRQQGLRCKLDVISRLGRGKDLEVDILSICSKIRQTCSNIDYSCGIGEDMFFVSPSGDIYPCPSIRDADFCYGNIREVSDLSDVHAWMESLRIDGRTCPGCRAHAIEFTGDIRGVDPIYEELSKIERCNIPVL